MRPIDQAADPPPELVAAVAEFWPEQERANALAISQLESGWDAFADADTTSAFKPCGYPLRIVDGVTIFAEHSVGYFQINVCNFPSWDWKRLWNAHENAGTAHMLYDNAGGSWRPWYFSATKLGLI